MDSQIIDMELDPLGYAPRANLYVRNLSRNTIQFTEGKVHWSCPPWPDENHQRDLPWTVAKSAGFERLWRRGRVMVSLDADFDVIIHQLPESGVGGGGNSGSHAYVHRQEIAQSVVSITHDLNREGPVNVVVYSLDYAIEYWNFYTSFINKNVCQLSFEDPITFVATVS